MLGLLEDSISSTKLPLVFLSSSLWLTNMELSKHIFCRNESPQSTAAILLNGIKGSSRCGEQEASLGHWGLLDYIRKNSVLQGFYAVCSYCVAVYHSLLCVVDVTAGWEDEKSLFGIGILKVVPQRVSVLLTKTVFPVITKENCITSLHFYSIK